MRSKSRPGSTRKSRGERHQSVLRFIRAALSLCGQSGGHQAFWALTSNNLLLAHLEARERRTDNQQGPLCWLEGRLPDGPELSEPQYMYGRLRDGQPPHRSPRDMPSEGRSRAAPRWAQQHLELGRMESGTHERYTFRRPYCAICPNINGWDWSWGKLALGCQALQC